MVDAVQSQRLYDFSLAWHLDGHPVAVAVVARGHDGQQAIVAFLKSLKAPQDAIPAPKKADVLRTASR